MAEDPILKHSATLDKALAWSIANRFSLSRQFAIVTVAVLVVGLVRGLFITELVPWLFFIPVIIASALLLSRDAGVFASVLAAIVAGFTIGSSDNAFWMTGPQWAGSILFLLVVVGLAVLVGELRYTFARNRGLTETNAETNILLGEREAFLASVLASSTDCIKVLDLDGRLTFMSEGGQKVMEVSDFNAISGCPWPAFWNGAGNVQAEAAVKAARKGQSSSFIARASTMGGTEKWWDVAVSPILGVDGQPKQILSVSRDITASRYNEEQHRQLGRIVETTTDFVGMADLDGTVYFLNDAALNMVGLSRERLGRVHVTDFFPPAEASQVEKEVLPAVAEKGHWIGELSFRHFLTGQLIPVLYNVFPVSDTDGKLVGYGTVTRDFTERKNAEARQRLLNDELSHRLKNVLSVVQSVASQTLRQSQDLASANTALMSRLVALGEAASVLTANEWSSAGIHQLVRTVLGHHADIGDRIIIDGPELVLHPQAAMAFALALHELATNAAKYGALSNETGKVRLTWSAGEADDGNGPRLKLLWEEVGGPPVQPPSRRGFGSTMIERSLRAYFKGEAKLEYRTTGLRFEIDCPLDAAGSLES
ncbi:PAS domain-containing protein [Rhizobium wenxiniae]|uniref:PAS domain-containing protein n=1 Tax=Rhizobium wenxiniae TaxID=1737357 RepID=UPI001C6EB30F